MSGDASLTILLIEDNPGDARYIREILGEAAELSQRTVERGQGALAEPSTRDEPNLIHETRLAAGMERLDDERPDVVLLDLNLPDSDGLDTLTRMLERTESVPVVVLTGLRDRETGMEALRRGAEEYLVKDEINADLLTRSVYHAIERKAHERELKRYETLIEESTDVNVITGPDGSIRYLTPSVTHVLGYDPDELVGDNSLDYIHPDDREKVNREFAAMIEDHDYRPTIEFRIEHADGSWIDLQARGRNLLDEPLIEGLVVYTHDITERRERERTLERQREQLAALNDLNAVVRDITRAALRQSTREEIEELVCRRLAEADSYLFAWIGDVDQPRHRVVVRTEAGVDGYLDGVDITYDDSETGNGPTGRAIRTGEMQVCQNVLEDPEYEQWRDHAREYGFRSSAAVPLVHEGTLYGVLNVYTARKDGFAGQEGAVIGQLGEVIGHTLASIERKEALMSDDVIEIGLEIPNVFEAVGGPDSETGTITIERTVPARDETYLLYGIATEGIEALQAIVEALPHWESVEALSEGDEGVRFEARLDEPPVFTLVASQGGRVREAKIENGDYRLTVHLPHGSDIRRLVDSVQETYPAAEVIAQRQTTRTDESNASLPTAALFDDLTDRQRSVLESAFYSGFFEWPRESTGEDVADSLGISSATFHQHMRAGERKILTALFDED